MSAMLLHDNSHRLPRTHESQHDECRSNTGVILIPVFSRAPLRQTEHFDKENREEDEQNEPEPKQTDNNRQACPTQTVSR